MYKRLVKGDSDFLGHVAYAFYKSEKIQFVEQFMAKHSGRMPTPQECDTFRQVVSTDAHIESYNRQARDVIQRFLQNALDVTINQIEADNEKKIQNTVENLVTQQRKELEHEFSEKWKAREQSLNASYLKELDGRVTNALNSFSKERAQKSFWLGVFQSVCGAFIFAITIVLVVLINKCYGNGTPFIFE